MSALHLDGFGIYGAASHLDGVYVRGSTDPLLLNVNATGGRSGNGALLSLNTPTAWIERLLASAETTIVAQCAWNEMSSGVNGVSTIFNLRTNGGFDILTLGRDNASEVLVLREGGTGGSVLASGGTVLTGSLWHSIELRVVIHSSTGVAEVWVNGVPEFTFNGDTEGAAGGCQRVRLAGGTANAGSGQSRYTDFVISNASRLGDRTVEYHPAAVDLAQMDWVQSTGGTVEGVLDEVPANGDTDYATADTDGQRSEFETANPGYGASVTVTAVQPYAIARQENAGSHGLIVGLGVNGTWDDSAKQSLSTAYRSVAGPCLDTNPDTASPWLPAEIDDVEVAIEYAA